MIILYNLFKRKMNVYRLRNLIPNKGVVAYSALDMGFSLLSGVFNFYYVKVFLNHYDISESWFQLSQILYMIWNAVNDPLFAYWQDTVNNRWTRTRRESILYTSPLFGISFLVAWFPWGSGADTPSWVVGMHLITALFLYDTLYTFIGLAACCVFTELSNKQEDRTELIRFSSIGKLIGSSGVFFVDYFSKGLQDFAMFQVCCVITAIVSSVLMIYTGLNAHTQYDTEAIKKCENPTDDIQHEKDNEPMWKLTWQILKDQNFLAFVFCNFMQQFNNSLYSGFTAIIVDKLTEESLSVTSRSYFYGFSSIFPAILTIVGASVINKVGYYRLILYSFVWKILSGLSMFVLGMNHPLLLLLIMLFENAFRMISFHLFNMPLSNIADRNMEQYKRKHPVTSMVFGTNALIVKPALSLSPMLVSAILESCGYRQVKGKIMASDTALKEKEATVEYTMFLLLCFYPLLLGALQVCAWSFFKIRHSHKSHNS